MNTSLDTPRNFICRDQNTRIHSNMFVLIRNKIPYDISGHDSSSQLAASKPGFGMTTLETMVCGGGGGWGG